MEYSKIKAYFRPNKPLFSIKNEVLVMARAKRHYIPGQIWHITHRCHKREFLLKFAKDCRRWLQCLIYIDLNMVRAGLSSILRTDRPYCGYGEIHAEIGGQEKSGDPIQILSMGGKINMVSPDFARFNGIGLLYPSKKASR